MGDWIPCSEELPKVTGTYLVTTAKGTVYWDRFYVDNQAWGHEAYGHRYKGKHRAWQPLPDPYRER